VNTVSLGAWFSLRIFKQFSGWQQLKLTVGVLLLSSGLGFIV
jgi:hypothetical protein